METLSVARERTKTTTCRCLGVLRARVGNKDMVVVLKKEDGTCKLLYKILIDSIQE